MTAKQEAIQAIQDTTIEQCRSLLQKAVREAFPDFVQQDDLSNGLQSIKTNEDDNTITITVGRHTPREAKEIGNFLKGLFQEAGSPFEVSAVTRDACYHRAVRDESGKEAETERVEYYEQ